MRQSWTDERLDALNGKVDRGFDRLDARMDRIDDKFDRVEDRFDRMDEKFDRMDAKINELDLRLTGRLDKLIYVMVVTSVSLVASFVAAMIAVVTRI